MKKEFEFYYNVIKPLEIKYNRLLFIYSFIPLKYFKRKKTFYNNLLIKYYKMLQNNKQLLQLLDKYLDL